MKTSHILTLCTLLCCGATAWGAEKALAAAVASSSDSGSEEPFPGMEYVESVMRSSTNDEHGFVAAVSALATARLALATERQAMATERLTAAVGYMKNLAEGTRAQLELLEDLASKMETISKAVKQMAEFGPGAGQMR